MSSCMNIHSILSKINSLNLKSIIALYIIQSSDFIYDFFDTVFTSVVSTPKAVKKIEKELNVGFQLELCLITSVLHYLCCMVSNMLMSFN